MGGSRRIIRRTIHRGLPVVLIAVKKEFDGIKALFGEYQASLKKVYTVPVVPDPR
jgi:hypothetical protein